MPLFTTSRKAAATTPELPPELQKVLTAVGDLASPPEVVARIIQVVEDPLATAKDIRDVVQSDPVLATKLLRIVNSAFYGLPSQVASLERAILMLGTSAVRNLALATSMARLVKDGPIHGPFTARDLWRHSIAVGVAARMLAEAAHFAQADELLAAGLVHDIGLIVAQQLFPAHVAEVVKQCLEQPQSFTSAEIRVMSADHQAFGGALAGRWRFPPGLRNAIAYHHDPLSLQPEFQRVATLVHLADILCCQTQHGFWLTAGTQTVADWMLAAAQLTLADLERVAVALPACIEEAEQIFSTN